MKDAQDYDRRVWLHYISYSVVAVKKNSNVSLWFTSKPVPHFGKDFENVYSLVNSLDNTDCRGGIVLCNVFVNVFKPCERLIRPPYSCHERIRRATSS